MLAAGDRVICTSRHPERLARLDLAEAVRLEIPSDVSLGFLPLHSYVVYSIPPVDGYDALLWRSLAERQPKRVVYLSTTGVYGQQRDVNEHTPPSPRQEHDRQRVEAESAAFGGPWQSIVLRPAAIYGPGRGIHESMARGRYRLVGSGDNFVSRIHVDDLAAHVEAALLSDLSGAWPVADEEPCTSSEIAHFCADLLSLPVPDSIPANEAHHTRRADRRVDGSGIRAKLGVRLRYPTYRLGIPASL
jgi:nucleoside-diphosphate-sugar epimerase